MLEFDGTKLKALRKAQKLTQTELGQKVGKKVEHISHYENGYANPPSNVLLNLMKFFNASPSDLGKAKSN
jgi:transcriptional regulator with XRE-family HTH domain